MPSSANYVRDYKQERRTAVKRGETSKGSSSGDATRHRARRKLEKEGRVSKGDGKDVDHKRSLKSGGSNSTKNLKVTSQKSNRSKGGKAGNKAGKAAGARKGHKSRKA